MQKRKASNWAGAPLLGRRLAVQPHPRARGALSRSGLLPWGWARPPAPAPPSGPASLLRRKVLPQDPAQPSPGPLRAESIPPSPGYGLSSLVTKLTCSEANLLPARTTTDSCKQDDFAPECKLSGQEQNIWL